MISNGIGLYIGYILGKLFILGCIIGVILLGIALTYIYALIYDFIKKRRNDAWEKFIIDRITYSVKVIKSIPHTNTRGIRLYIKRGNLIVHESFQDKYYNDMTKQEKLRFLNLFLNGELDGDNQRRN